MKSVKFVDLFAGTGGIRLAFEEAISAVGFHANCVKSIEIDQNACKTYELNFGENPHGDIRQQKELPPFDALLAGFPCQAFSYAGKQRGFADTRGTLFFEVERILREYRPKFCFLENVRGLTTHDGGKTFRTILAKLNDLGYNVEYRLINASALGLPQNRVRIYIVCLLNKHPVLSINDELGSSDSHSYKNDTLSLWNSSNLRRFLRVKDILEDAPSDKYNCSPGFIDSLRKLLKDNFDGLHGKRLIDTRHGNSIHSWDIGIKGSCSSAEKELLNLLVCNRRRSEFGTLQDGKALTIEQIRTFYEKDNIIEVLDSLLRKGYLRKTKEGRINLVCGNMSFEVFKFLDPESVAITLTASDANRLGVYHKNRLRRITPRECARLQGYPDSYKLNPIDSFAYKQMGNAVCVPVIKEIIMNVLENTKDIF